MNTALEFPYKPRLGASLSLLSLALVCIVFMAGLALTNDEGLNIDGIFTLGPDGATSVLLGDCSCLVLSAFHGCQRFAPVTEKKAVHRSFGK